MNEIPKVTIGEVFKELYNCISISHTRLFLALNKFIKLVTMGKLSKVDIMDIEQTIEHIQNILQDLMIDLVSAYAPDLIMYLQDLLDLAKAINDRELQKLIQEEINSLRQFIEKA